MTVPAEYRTDPAWVGEDAYLRGWPAPATTPKENDVPNPPTRQFGLAETVIAHRVYMGVGLRTMAARLKFDRRDYQRIENGQNQCPVGFIDKVEDLVDQFDQHVDVVVNEARTRGGVKVAIQHGPEMDWERHVAYRAAVLEPEVTLVRVDDMQKEVG